MSLVRPQRPSVLRAVIGLGAGGALCLAMAGCQPEPGSSAGPTPDATPAQSSSASATPPASPTPTPQPGEDISLPTACEQLYSPQMLATLQQEQAPLNDPGVTMYSSQVVTALEVLGSGVPSIRCTWGMPSESGLATTVSLVDQTQSAAILDALAAEGFACVAGDAGTLCSFEQESITQDDVLVARGETHYLAGNGWVSTAWITYDPEGYTEDIVATLWG